MQQGDRVGTDHFQGLLLLRGQGHPFCGGGRTGRQLEQPRVAALPARGLRARGTGAAHAGRKHRPDAFDHRHPVVVGDQARERDLMRQEQWLLAGACDGLRIDAWLFGPERDDKAVRVAAAERHRDPVARHHVDAFGD